MKTKYLFFLSIIIAFIFISSCTPPGYLRTRELIFTEDNRDEIVRTAEKYRGIMYKEGGTTPSGFDCSGFTRFVYRENGYGLPRNVYAQYSSGRRVRLASARPGDLVFFTINGYNISHVGIYIGNFTFIHAPRTGKRVSYSSIKNPYWEKRYAGAVTYFPER